MLRVWLEATRLGLAVHPMTAAMDSPAIRAGLASAFGTRGAMVVCLRLGTCRGTSPRSPRRPLDLES
jgi:hypothetical protein